MADEPKIVTPSDEEVKAYAGESAGDAQEERRHDPSAGPAEPEPVKSDSEPAQSEAAVWKDKYLRTLAEMQNSQKRAMKEKAEALKYANAGFARSLLPVLDDLERVVQAGADPKATAQTLIEGIRLTLDQFLKVLRENNVTRVESEGKPFNPEVHEALMEQPTSDHPPKTVLQEVQKGYLLHDRLLRPARVIISKPMAEES